MFSARWENLCFLCASVFQIPRNRGDEFDLGSWP